MYRQALSLFPYCLDSSAFPEKILDLRQIENLMLLSSVVKIEGVKLEDIDDDTMDNIFSTEYQGGGEIANIKFQEDMVYITFVEPTGVYMFMK